MARYVTVSTAGPVPMQIDDQKDLQQNVDAMKARWNTIVSELLPDHPDIIVLPEACDRYCDLSSAEKLAYFHARGDQILDFFSGIAKEHHCYVAYSTIMEKGDGTLRNATRIIDRQGEIAGVYCKMHPVIEETTEMNIIPGKSADLIQCDFGTVACTICFDLNFEDPLDLYKKNRPDIILFSSMYHGGLMQSYWAYASQCHFVSACAGLPSAILSPLGEVLAETTPNMRAVTRRINLDCAVVHIDENMDRIRAAKQKYGPALGVSVPGLCNLLVLSSETTDCTVAQMIEEFHIETWDAYYRRSLDFHNSHREA